MTIIVTGSVGFIGSNFIFYRQVKHMKIASFAKIG